MGSVGEVYDNEMVESFFAYLEYDLIDRHYWKNEAEAGLALLTWIE